MAQIVGVYQTAHTPFCYRTPQEWCRVRGTRPVRPDVPVDDLETNEIKHARVQKSFAVLRQQLAHARPDVVVIFGDDQLECFDFSNYPAFSIYVGEEFEGFLPGAQTCAKTRLKGHPKLAVALLTGLMKRGIDPAFCMDMPKPDFGIGHAFMNPAYSLTDLNTPIVPILINCFYAPQPTAARCYQLGRAVREIIDELPDGLRVALVGSGGLWHTPQKQDAWLNDAFDQALLGHMASGNIRAMAEHFDAYRIPAGDLSQDIGTRGKAVTGMPAFGGPQGGTRETCNWIAAAGAVDGTTATIVDCVPIYASPINAAFAYFNL
jgi:aromatic ring-opening dioxygenase catalytic subunit (LigB family)